MLHSNINPNRLNKLCRHPERYSAEEPKSTENELLDLVYGLVRALQPDWCLETGTYTGRTAQAITSALTANGVGQLDTLEINPDLATKARDLLPMGVATVHVVNANTWRPPDDREYEFCWFDTDGKTELAAQFRHYQPWITQGALVCFHDTGTAWPTTTALAQLEQEGLLKVVHVPTPRGASICEVL